MGEGEGVLVGHRAFGCKGQAGDQQLTREGAGEENSRWSHSTRMEGTKVWLVTVKRMEGAGEKNLDGHRSREWKGQTRNS